MATGCRVTTDVSVAEPSPGSGSVAVRVTLDSDALAAVGGLAALRAQLARADLTAAGWSVDGPVATVAGGATIVATHRFENEPDASQLLAQIAGPGRFRLSLGSHDTFWHTEHRLVGRVDLTCDLECFGDSGLAAVTGSALGVDPGSERRSAARDFPFSLEAQLPGGVHAANGQRRGATLVWTPVLGQAIAVSAETETLNTASVVGVAVAGGIVVLAAGGTTLWRRRRRRLPKVGRAVPAPGSDPGSDPEAVTPPS